MRGGRSAYLVNGTAGVDEQTLGMSQQDLQQLVLDFVSRVSLRSVQFVWGVCMCFEDVGRRRRDEQESHRNASGSQETVGHNDIHKSAQNRRKRREIASTHLKSRMRSVMTEETSPRMSQTVASHESVI